MVQAEINDAETLKPERAHLHGQLRHHPQRLRRRVRGDYPSPENAKNAAVNAVIGINVTKFHRNISLIDWQATMAPYADLCPTGVTYTTPLSVDRTPCFVDGVHPNEAGYLLRTQMIRNAVGP